MRFDGANEGAHKFAVYFGRDRIHVDVLAGQELPSIFDAINSRWLNLNVLKSGSRKFRAILVLFERTGNVLKLL